MITLHQFEISPFCDKIRRVLEYKGLDYRVEEVPLSTAPLRIKRFNRIGKLPALEHDGKVVADSTHIARYLDERFPQPPIYPAAPRERALCHVFEEWADESLFFYEVRLRFSFAANMKRWIGKLVEREPAPVRALAPLMFPGHFKRILVPQGIGRKPEEMVLRELDEHCQALAQLLQGRTWLCGDALSIADISVFAQIAAIRDTVEGGHAVARQSALGAWMERVDQATRKGALVQAGAPARSA